MRTSSIWSSGGPGRQGHPPCAARDASGAICELLQVGIWWPSAAGTTFGTSGPLDTARQPEHITATRPHGWDTSLRV